MVGSARSTSRSYEPIRPPPFFVTTITDGLGGTPSLKSGQRVAGSSKVDFRPKGGQLSEDEADALCVLAWVLDEIGEAA